MPTREEKIAELERLKKIEELKSLRASDRPKPEKAFGDEVLDAGEAGLAGAAQGATFGFADEIAGGAKTAYDTAFGDKKFSEVPGTYRSNRDKIRGYFEKKAKESPAAFTAGEVGGSIGSAFIPGLGFANAAKAGGLAKGLGAAAKMGALTGAGTSTADATKGEFGDLAADTATGAAVGATTDLALRGAGKALKQVTPKNVAKKLSNVFLNTPEEVTEAYINNPQGVKNAPKRFELAKQFDEALEKLKQETTEGSAQSRNILKSEGLQIERQKVADIAKKMADDLEGSMEGITDDPQKMAALKYFRDFENQWKVRPDASETVSPGRLKDSLQSIDRTVDYDVGGGRFSPVDSRLKGDLRSQLDEYLKSKSPAYKEQMKGVAADADLLSRSSEMAKNPQAMSNVFRRSVTDQYGAGQVPAEVLKDFDKRMGTEFMEKAKLSNAREAFDKSLTQGSRNVNMFSNAMKDVPVVKHLAPLVGGTVDKYGRQMTMRAVDTAAAIEKAYSQNPNILAVRQMVKPLIDKARQGDPSAILTFQLLGKRNPEYIKLLEEEE